MDSVDALWSRSQAGKMTRPHGSFIERTGNRYGKFTVIGLHGKVPGTSIYRWLCRCDCGTEKTVRGGDLSSGSVASCGCSKMTTSLVPPRAVDGKTELICGACREYRDESMFGIRNDKRALHRIRGGRSHECRKCLNEKSNKWNKENPERARANKRRSHDKRLAAWRALIDPYKEKPCADCGVKYPPCVMDFDHRPESKKVDSVSRMHRFSREKVLAEIAKCDVVCANCHRLRTAARDQYRYEHKTKAVSTAAPGGVQSQPE